MKISTLNAGIDSAHFDLLLSAVRERAGFCQNTHAFKKGNLAMRLGLSLKRRVKIKKSEATKKCCQGYDDFCG